MVRLKYVVVPFVAVSGVALGAQIHLGRCHMSYCSWFSVEESQRVGSGQDGDLFRVVTKWWQTREPMTPSPSTSHEQDEWAAESYVFCSTARPAVISANDAGTWDAAYLAPASRYGVPGAAEAVTAHYFVVCHDHRPDGDFGKAAKGRGYSVTDEVPSVVVIDRPEDVLGR